MAGVHIDGTLAAANVIDKLSLVIEPVAQATNPGLLLRDCARTCTSTTHTTFADVVLPSLSHA